MIYILVALHDELADNLPELEGYTVVYTGVGKVNAAMHATDIALNEDCAMMINYGSAGALQQDLVGRLSEISVVRQRDMDARPLCALGTTPFETTDHAGDIDLGRPDGVVLSTGDQFVTSTPEVSSQMVDMEGYAIAKVAKLNNIDVVIVKFGSDFADENASQHWNDNCAKGQHLFLDWLSRHYPAI